MAHGEQGQVARADIDDLLMKKLPEVYSEKQRRGKIHNLITELRMLGKIRNAGSRRCPAWFLRPKEDQDG